MKKYRYFHIYDPEKIANLCPSKKQIAAMEDWVKSQSERIQRRFVRFKERVEYYWRLYPWLMVVVVVVALSSCAQTKYVVPNDTISNTSRYHGRHERDSIYLHDSIYVREYIQGDTVFRDKLVEHWKDRWLTRIDTLMQHDTTTITQTQTITQIEQVKYVPAFYKWCAAILILLVVGIAVRMLVL